MKQISILIVLMVLFVVGCGSQTNSGSLQLIKDFGLDVVSKEDATYLLNKWLSAETNFNPQDNKIESIDKIDDSYILKLSTAVKINGIATGIVGYRDYKISSDGKLFGYYYSK